MIFGDSYAVGSRVRQEETWSNVVSAHLPGLELVNLAVDGYSMAQAYLRFQQFRDKLSYNGALLMVVPSADMWREINTIRDLVFPWNLHVVQPRYILSESRLKLIRSPYLNPEDIYSDNQEDGLSERLKLHLQAYDRFYVKQLYEEMPYIGKLMTYKLFAASYGSRIKQRLLENMLRPGSEAMRMSHEIFLEMNRSVSSSAARFGLIILPTPADLERFRVDASYVEIWGDMVKYLCNGLSTCIDLGAALRTLPREYVDLGFDGTHFGPIMSRQIAGALVFHTQDGS